MSNGGWDEKTAAPTWSTDIPKRAGYYWTCPHGAIPYIAFVFHDGSKFTAHPTNQHPFEVRADVGRMWMPIEMVAMPRW